MTDKYERFRTSNESAHCATMVAAIPADRLLGKVDSDCAMPAVAALDGDGIVDPVDNCPSNFNPLQ